MKTIGMMVTEEKSTALVPNGNCDKVSSLDVNELIRDWGATQGSWALACAGAQLQHVRRNWRKFRQEQERTGFELVWFSSGENQAAKTLNVLKHVNLTERLVINFLHAHQGYLKEYQFYLQQIWLKFSVR